MSKLPREKVCIISPVQVRRVAAETSLQILVDGNSVANSKAKLNKASPRRIALFSPI